MQADGRGHDNLLNVMRLRSPVLFGANTLICPDKLNFQTKKCLFKHFQ